MVDGLQRNILLALSEEPAPVSLPRLGKRLGLCVSVLMRALTLMGEAPLGGQPGPGWVQVQLQDARWTASLTPAGRQQCAEWAHG